MVIIENNHEENNSGTLDLDEGGEVDLEGELISSIHDLKLVRK